MAEHQHTNAPDGRTPWTTPRLRTIDVLRDTKSGDAINADIGEDFDYRPS